MTAMSDVRAMSLAKRKVAAPIESWNWKLKRDLEHCLLYAV
jgi:hypothetical protein